MSSAGAPPRSISPSSPIAASICAPGVMVASLASHTPPSPLAGDGRGEGETDMADNPSPSRWHGPLPLPQGERDSAPSDFLPVIRRLAADGDIVDVALAQARSGDLHEAAIPLHLGDVAVAGIAHRRAQPAHELRDAVGDPHLVPHAAPHALRPQPPCAR